MYITAVPACDRYSPILRVAAIEAGYSAVKPDSVSQEFELLQNNFEYSKERKRSLLTSTSMSAFFVPNVTATRGGQIGCV